MKQTFTLLSSLWLPVLLLSSSLSAWAQTTYRQVPLTAASFTADIVANGTAAQPPTSSATADVDGAGYYFLSQDYYTATTAHTSGLPDNGAVANSIAGPSALTYQLASLSANNSLRLAGAATGTVTFVTPLLATDVYVLGASGSGSSTVDMTVNYSDGTTTTFAGRTYPDWFASSATQNVLGASARASTAIPISATAANNTAPFLSQVRLSIPTAKLRTTITGLTFTNGATGVLNIMAVSVAQTPVCTASPTNVTTVASTTAAGGTALTTACPNTSIYLSLSGVPANSGYTYQWQSSTASATTGFTNIANATSSTYIATNQAVATYYRAQVDCYFASSPATSTAVQVAQSPPSACYCTPSYSSGGNNDNIARVQIGTLDNTTTGNASPYYRDYSGQQTGATPTLAIPTLTAGSTTSATLTFGSDGSQYSAIWIDFNQDGSFSSSEYFTTNTNARANGTVVISLTVPTAALAGNTRLRVRGGDDAQPTSGQACGASSSSYGESEDYFVRIEAAPLPVQLVGFTVQRTSPSAVALTWTTASEVSNAGFEVERSADGTQWAPLTFVAGLGYSTRAHTYSYLDATSATTYYRLRQVDTDGTGTYSPIRVVAGAPGTLTLYPNPVTTGLVQILDTDLLTPLLLLDAQGRLVREFVAGTRSFEVSGLPAGFYLLRNGTASQRLVIP